MTINSLYPGFVKVHYTSNAHPHVAVLPVKPFLSFDGNWFVETKSGGVGQNLGTALATWCTRFKALLHTSSTIVDAELWTIASIGADPIFAHTYSLAVVGTSGTVANPYSQLVFTWRTSLGGLLRTYLMEGVTPDDTIYYPPSTGAIADIIDLFTGDNAWICGRDGGFGVGLIRAIAKENDALRKKYLLSA